MGCLEDEYNIEDISFSEGHPFGSEETESKKTKEEKKKKKNKKSKLKRSKKIKEKSVSKLTPIKESENESAPTEENKNENINSNKTEENEESEVEEEEEESKVTSSNIKQEHTNSQTSNTNNIITSERKSSSNISSNMNNTSNIDSSKTNSDKNNNKHKENKKESDIYNSNESSSNIKSNIVENSENNSDNNKTSDDKSVSISNSKENKNNENDDKKNNIVVNEDWLEGFINETFPFNRKNINSKISPNDPIMRNLIDSKEKELILSPGDLISYHKENPSKKYKVLDLLGSGSFGKVFKAVNNITRNLVAIKKTKKYLTKNKDLGEPNYIHVKNEIEILKKLNHPSIVKIYEVYDIREFYFQINEYCKYNNLYDYYKFHLSEKQICIILYQILSGVLYLHEHNIVHRDLKLENIMVDHIEKDLTTSEPYFFIKIIDFGSCKVFNKEKKETQLIGTSYYIAPEVINKSYNEKCDLWSVGVILYMLIGKKPPFDGYNLNKIFEKIIEEEYNKHSRKILDFSDEVRDLLDKLLEKNIEKRLSAKEALNHPWFKKYNGRAAFANFKFEDLNLILDKLFNVKYLNKLQDLVLNYLVHNSPSNEENIKIMKIFRYFNYSGNGKLTREELKKGLYRYKLKSEVNAMVDDLFQKLEIKKDKDYIEYQKFVTLCIDKDVLFSKENLKDVFNFINYDNGEGITAKKIMLAFNITEDVISEAVFNNLIIKKDNNNDMIITYSEFESIIRS